MTSAIEAEILKLVKLKPAGEPRHVFLNKVLEAGQGLSLPQWESFTAEAQKWYNDAIIRYNAHNDTKDIPDFPGVQTQAFVDVSADEDEDDDIPEEENEIIDEEQEEDEEEEDEDSDPDNEELTEDEDVPRQYVTELRVEDAEDDEDDDEGTLQDGGEDEEDDDDEEEPPPPPKPAPKPAPKPVREPVHAKARTVAPPPQSKLKAKPAPAPVRAVKTPPPPPPKHANSGKPAAAPPKPVSRPPPPPSSAGSATLIKRLLVQDIHMTNAELVERLKAENCTASQVSISSTRSDFKHSIMVLQEAGYCKELVL